MTQKIGNVLVIAAENPQQCDYCNAIRELRPYGRNGAMICHPCGMKPENKAETERQFGKLLGSSNA